MVLRGGPHHRGTTDVDLFDAIVGGGARGDRLGERVEIDHDQVERRNPEFVELLAVRGETTICQEAGMNPKRFPLTREVTAFVLIYLYVPVIVLIAYSFNANRTATVWSHVSLDRYGRILVNPSIQAAAKNSLVLALCAATAATAIALLAALATSQAFPRRRAVEAVLNMPLILPEIVVAVATLMLFVALGVQLGLGAMILAHTAFCIPFAYLPIRARLEGMNQSYGEAAQDLYANRFRSFRRVTLPLLWPGIMAGFTLAFVTSLDDFLTSFFLSGPGTTTLPVYIFSSIKAGITPEINAISTVMLVISVLLVSLSFILGRLRR